MFRNRVESSGDGKRKIPRESEKEIENSNLKIIHHCGVTKIDRNAATKNNIEKSFIFIISK